MNKYKEMKYERVIKELIEEIDRISEDYDELLTKYKKLTDMYSTLLNIKLSGYNYFYFFNIIPIPH